MGKSNVIESVRKLLRQKGDEVGSAELAEQLDRLRVEQTALTAAVEGAQAARVSARATGTSHQLAISRCARHRYQFARPPQSTTRDCL